MACWREFVINLKTAKTLASKIRRACGVSVRRNVFHLEGDDIATAQLAVDCQIEHRQVALAVCDLEFCADRPDESRSGGLAPTSLPLFQGPRLSEGATEASLSCMVILLVGENGQHGSTQAFRVADWRPLSE